MMDFINSIRGFLDGKKTYIVVIVTLVYAVTSLMLGYIDQQAAIQMILAALGLGGLRSGQTPPSKTG